jgi:hypothetical protein
MIKAPPFTYTNESITVVWEGKPHVVKKGSPQFANLRTALMEENWEEAPKHLTVAKSISAWAKGKFTVKGDHFSFEGTELPADINNRIVEMATKGEDPTPLFKFWERLQRNPSKRSVDQLWPFLSHQGVPLTKEGTFLAYKGVNDNYTDKHTGTISNKPGIVNKMPRNKISDDPREACHEGFHVGALGYARSFASRVIICEVDPEHVVCVPYDESQQKMRVCEYKVVGNHNGEYLPSTTFAESTIATKLDKAVEQEQKAKTPKEKKQARKALKKAGKQIAKEWAALSKMDVTALLGQSLDTLRAYAGKGLKIVGASKIPGGKTALVSTIIDTRDREKAAKKK